MASRTAFERLPLPIIPFNPASIRRTETLSILPLVVGPAAPIGCPGLAVLPRVPGKARPKILAQGVCPEHLVKRRRKRLADVLEVGLAGNGTDRKSTRLNSSHLGISYAV